MNGNTGTALYAIKIYILTMEKFGLFYGELK
jgi:hypothetical protein